MIIDLKEFYTINNQTIEHEGYPLLNDSYSQSRSLYINQQPENYSEVLKYIRKSPETLAIFNAIATDISSDGVYFTPHKKQGGKSNIEKARDFYRKNLFKSEFKAGLIDWLMLGNCAFWKGLGKRDLKEFMEKKFKVDFKEHDYEAVSDSLKKFKQVAWSTMYISHDMQEITAFKQVVGTGDNLIVDEFGNEIDGKRSSVGTHTRVWYPETIIHGKFMCFDGKVYGYTPTFSLLPVISTQILLKDYLGNFFQNGGVPDWMFILPGELANSPNVKRLEQMLGEYKRSVRKHGNMIIPGDVKPVELNKFDKDMEFRALAIYYTAVLAFSFNMPMGRLQAILGMENKSKESAMADESYWRTISEAQDYWKDLFDEQLWIPFFGVEMHFKKTYKQDQIRESQNYLFLQNYVEGMNKVLAQNKKQLSQGYIEKIFQLNDGDIVEAKELPIESQQNNQNFMPDKSLTGKDQQNRNEKRMQQEQAKERKRMM